MLNFLQLPALRWLISTRSSCHSIGLINRACQAARKLWLNALAAGRLFISIKRVIRPDLSGRHSTGNGLRKNGPRPFGLSVPDFSALGRLADWALSLPSVLPDLSKKTFPPVQTCEA